MEDITLSKIRNKSNINDSIFLDRYRKLIYGEKLLNKEKYYLLRVALYFLNSNDQDIQKFGYGIILKYSNFHNDYGPLYDIAINLEYIPISKFIEIKYPELISLDNFSNLYLAAYQENFKLAGDEIYRSRGQMILNKFSTLNENIAIVAPTSYGKSEMMLKKIENHLNKKICIIVPSKALLSQTKRTLLKNIIIKQNFKKIITHPDMYKKDNLSFLAVLTQERLLMLLQKNEDLFVDLLLIDEAHNLLQDEKDNRSRLLAQVIILLKKRNPLLSVNFFTPFLVDIKNLNIFNCKIELKGKKIIENLKVEKFYAYDSYDKKLYLYDQFLGKLFTINNDHSDNEINFILNNKASKNIIYLNRPRDAESVALKVAVHKNEIGENIEIKKIIHSIEDLVHPDYDLIKCMKRGIVYHHGVIPDIIRLYIEDIFSRYNEFDFIVTTSTLLEGVNIPAEKIFLLTPVKGKNTHLNPSQFKNLIGRVCRFKEVFDYSNGNLNMLEPKIYLIKGSYSKNLSLLSFYNSRVDLSKKIEDIVNNPLLENSKSEKGRKESLEYLENIEKGSSGLTDIKRPNSLLGKLCFKNNIHDFDIIKNESTLLKNYERIIKNKINNPSVLIETISEIFLRGIELNNENIARLREEEARNFYAMFVNWRTKGSVYKVMIENFLGYWEKLEKIDPRIYVGQTRGEVVKKSAKGKEGFIKLWVNMNEKNRAERINLAIIKIKEEQEFVDFNILKYVEILNELDLIDSDFFDQVKYGTSNKKMICMLKNGFSIELSKIIKDDKYDKYLEFNLDEDIITYGKELITTMKKNNENEVLIFEAENNL
jgi:hypothetical protein